MLDSTEYLLTTSVGSQHWTVCLWDYNSESGNVLKTYKGGGIAAAKSLNQMGNSYLLTANQNQPLLHVWTFNNQDPVKDLKCILPAIANVVTVSPDNVFLAIGIGTKLYIWQLCNGKLLGVFQKHLQNITCLKFSENSDYLITTAEDGTVLMYNFGDLICSNNDSNQSEIGQVEPIYSRSDHTLGITDVHIGKFGLKSRFATVSLDCTCRVYDLYKGQPLLQLVFDEPLTCITVDSVYWNLFVGTTAGSIQQFRLHNPPRSFTHHILKKEEKLNFIGHTKRITCLDLNITNSHLVSGSEDNQILIWNVQSRQILNKIEHKGTITNVRFLLFNKDLLEQNFKPAYVLKSLERNIDTDSSHYMISMIQTEDIVFTNDENSSDEEGANSNAFMQRIRELEDQHKKDEIIKRQMYEALLKKASLQ